MTSPEEGEVPSFTAASEKYSKLSDSRRGEGGRRWMSSAGSRADLWERSEARGLIGGRVLLCEGLKFGLNANGLIPLPVGLIGEVAIGEKKGSTMGLTMAVRRAVSSLRGPAGFGNTMTSGTKLEGLGVERMEWMRSFTTL